MEPWSHQRPLCIAYVLTTIWAVPSSVAQRCSPSLHFHFLIRTTIKRGGKARCRSAKIASAKSALPSLCPLRLESCINLPALPSTFLLPQLPRPPAQGHLTNSLISPSISLSIVTDQVLSLTQHEGDNHPAVCCGCGSGWRGAHSL
jgi:hypothetical protein